MSAQSSPPIQPIGIYFVNPSATCQASAGESRNAQSSGKQTNEVGQGISWGSTGTLTFGVGDPALASFSAGAVNPSGILQNGIYLVKIGELAGPGSQVSLRNIGASAKAKAGWAYDPGDPVSQALQPLFPFSAQPADVFCQIGESLMFSNPNPFPVQLIIDDQLRAFAAASNDAAVDPISGVVFGFPGGVNNVMFAEGPGEPGNSGLYSTQAFKRTIITPTGTTVHEIATYNCFDASEVAPPLFCTNNSPVDTTYSSNVAPITIPAFNQPGQVDSAFYEPNPDDPEINLSANSNFATDAQTGQVSLIRSGYALMTVSEAVTIMLAGSDVSTVEASTPVSLVVTGHSPVNLLVIDGQGHRVGVSPATSSPALPLTNPPTVDSRQEIVAEIFGASYSGPGSSPQVIDIPNPDSATTYQIKVLGTGSGPYLLTMQTFNVDGVMLDQQSQSGTASPGSVDSFNLVMNRDGHLSVPGAAGSDTIPPVTSALSSPPPNAAGWNNSNVAVTLTAADGAGGSGVKEITYSTSGVQTVGTAVAASVANFLISSEGQTTVTFFATDNAGNSESPKQLAVAIDKTAPGVSCGMTDGRWHASDVSIACSANDGLSGLANSADSSFTLTTSVPAGTETANAVTGSRTVCDVAGNCSTAGPIGGNMVDKRPPAISISTPATGTYLLNQALTASYGCNDGGSGIASCAGPVASGNNLSTSTVGSKTFTVTAVDNAGNTAAPGSVSYTVAYKVCPLYDPTRSVQSGSTIPLKIQICDASNNDASSPSVIVHAVRLVQTNSNASEALQSAGSANPDNDFRYDSTLGSTGGYIFNLSTRGLSTGSYALIFAAGGDPTLHQLPFQVR
jgi:hypothetical protein